MYKFFDLHCDTLTSCFENNKQLYKNDLHIDLNRINNFKGSIQVFAIWLKSKYYLQAFDYTNKIIEFYNEQLEKNSNIISKIYEKKDLFNCSNKLKSILAIEGGESLERNIDNLEYFFKKGVRILTLCWNYENNLGYGILSKSNLGLKDFGKEVVLKMNDLNMIIDISHLNEAGFWDVYNISKKPFIATHSNCYSICKNLRNLKDNQIKAIAQKGGLVGINIYPIFVCNKKVCNTNDIIKHIDYISKIIGFDNICLGGDFDGIDKTPEDISNILGYKNLFEKIEKKYGVLNAEKIFFENAFNFFKNLDDF